ncbi:protein of unknown function [Moritella yayanosii]|uniref:Uncharacterized protein n=1 Tax=Moritella yayanosii TaxID=69539 RepID=A0A330LN15_9GAMM|nr:protein of unknown function [Moritella yayanosii]
MARRAHHTRFIAFLVFKEQEHLSLKQYIESKVQKAYHENVNKT